MKQPTITVLDHEEECRRARLHIEGGTLAEGWSPRKGKDAWCEVVVYLDDSCEEGWVGAFGGEVWPAAWPQIFHVLPRTKDGQSTALTDEGVRLANAAIFGSSAV